MTCDELLKMLNDYVDGDIDPGVCEGFEEHLMDCNPCQIVVDNVRQSIRIIKENAEVCEIPITFRARLHDELRRKWAEKHGRV